MAIPMGVTRRPTASTLLGNWKYVYGNSLISVAPAPLIESDAAASQLPVCCLQTMEVLSFTLNTNRGPREVLGYHCRICDGRVHPNIIELIRKGLAQPKGRGS